MEFFYLSTLEGSFKSGERMPASVVRAESGLNGTGTSKEELGRWACTFKDSDFIGKFVYPTVDSGLSGAGAGLACETTVVQNTGTGRLTLRYDFETGQTLYAKLYTDELGAHSYQIMKELWNDGFNRVGQQGRGMEPGLGWVSWWLYIVDDLNQRAIILRQPLPGAAHGGAGRQAQLAVPALPLGGQELQEGLLIARQRLLGVGDIGRRPAGGGVRGLGNGSHGFPLKS